MNNIQKFLYNLSNNLADDLFNDYFSLSARSEFDMNIKRTDDGVVVELPIPGFSKEQVKVYQSDCSLYITASKSEADTKDYLYKRWKQNNFSKVIPLDKSSEVKSATLTDGVLAVTIKNIEPKKSIRDIEVN